MDRTPHVLRAEPLTAQAFAPFGDVIEAGLRAPHFTINEGHAEHYHDLARIDANGEGRRPLLSIFADRLRCFLAAPGQGVNHARGVWHRPLLAIDAAADFVVIDRGGPGDGADGDEHRLDGVWVDI